MAELAYVSYRPARVAFLVRPYSLGDVLEAARVNSILWGGRWNPLVAVADAAAATAEIARFRADFLHPLFESDDVRAVIEAHEHLRWPMGEDGLLRVPYGEEHEQPTLLDVAPAIEDFYAERGWAIPRTHFRLFEWDDDDELAAFFAVRFGDLSGDVAGQYRALFEQQLRAERARPRETDFGERYVPSPIDATTFSLRGDFFGRAGRGVVAGDPRNPSHLRAYWNLRAGGYNVDFFVGQQALDRELECNVSEHRRRVDELHPPDRALHVFGLGGGEVPERLRELLDGLETLRYEDTASAFSDDRPPSLAVTESHDVLAAAEALGEGRGVLQLPLVGKPFPRADLSWKSQQWVVSVTTPTERSDGTIRMPFLPRLNRRLWDLALRLREIRVEWDRTGVLAGVGETHLTLMPQTSFQLLEAIFAEAGISIEHSPSGRAAYELIRQLGRLQRARLFRLPGVRRLVESREAHVGMEFSRAVEVIRDGFAEAGPLYVSGKRLQEPEEVFRFLLERRLFIAGLELRCPRCEHASTLAPRDLDDEVRCPKCGEISLLAPCLRRARWHFRITGLLEQRAQHVRPDDPEQRPPEPIAVLLTLVWLHDAAIGSGPQWETNLRVRGDGIDFEVDAVALELGRHGRIAVALGECRTHRRFDDRDLTRLSLIAEKLRAIGLECHLLFATLRDGFDADELERFRELRDHERLGEHVLPRPPILLARGDLETTWFAGTEDGFHGSGRDDLARMAAASDSVYLSTD